MTIVWRGFHGYLLVDGVAELRRTRGVSRFGRRAIPIAIDLKGLEMPRHFTKARTILGYEQIVDFKDGLRQTVNGYRDVTR